MSWVPLSSAWNRYALSLISTTLFLQSGATALAPRADGDVNTICEKKIFEDESRGFEYGPNAWNPTSEGFQCLTINEEDDNVWFNAPWSWVGDKDNVHSFPHVKFESKGLNLPLQLADITSMRLTGSWMITLDTLETELPKFSASEWDQQKSSLEEQGVIANAAFDMFLDADSDNSTDSIAAGIELMIWIGNVGDPWPLKTKTLGTQLLGDMNFTLYYGTNQRDHQVFTWVPDSEVGDITEFDEDISPLLEYIWRNDLMPNSTYLGIVEFGSEAWQASVNVTFSAAGYNAIINSTGASTTGSNISSLPEGCCNLDEPDSSDQGRQFQAIRGGWLLAFSLILWSIG